MIKIFVIMPYDKQFDDVANTIKHSAEKVNYSDKVVCKRLDDSLIPGRISKKLIDAIQEANIIITDITDNNPNVMWETGYAMASNKPLIQITQSIKNVPFDLKDLVTIEYERNNLFDTLFYKIQNSIHAILDEYNFNTPISFEPSNSREFFSISVTGSMNIDVYKFKHKFNNIITPYIGKKINWFVGSDGMADETVASFLCELKEKVIIVGYHSFDKSSEIESLIQKYNLPFINSQKEELPEFPHSTSKRDIYMLTNSEITILLWDGESNTTKSIIEWYKRIKRDHLICFCGHDELTN